MNYVKKSVADAPLKGKKVLLRCDFNVPLKNGVIGDDTRIRAALETIRFILKEGGAVIACSHLGRPKGQVVPEMSLKPVAERLGQLLGLPVAMAPDCVGAETEAMAKALQPGGVLLLENLRFHKEEEKNDPEFARALASLADIHVSDADEMENAKLEGREYVPLRYENGDTRKELLARSRYLLFKSADKWTDRQKKRARILFELYPDLQKAYSLCHSLRMIFAKNTVRDAARLSMAKWYSKVEEAGFHSFNVIAATFYEHYDDILNFYNNRSSNAAAESFNAKVKAFRAALRGIRDEKFFLYRLSLIYAYPH